MNRFIQAAVYFASELRHAWRNAVNIAAGRITVPEIEDDSMQRCEACPAVLPIEEMTSSEDGCWFCSDCVNRWKAEAA